MTNEEYQSLVLQELKGIRGDISDLKEGQTRLEQRLGGVEQRLDGMEQRLDGVGQRLDGMEQRLEKIEIVQSAIYDQTAVLTEFRTEVNMRLNSIAENNISLQQIIGRHEVEITTMKRKLA